jgi:protease-4
VSLLLEQLDIAREDPRVKGVILRINSPGGTVVASELMRDEILHFRKSGKPVVAVLMDVAASGGYYIACACDEIVAQPSTVTGSIGVLMQTVDVSGTMNLIGVKSDAITSGPNKDAGSPLRAMKPEERQLFQTIVNEMHDRFVRVVDEGRANLDEQQVRALADGRIYTARQALEAGLIDRVAGMREAVAVAKQRAGVKRVRLVTYHRPFDYRANYYSKAPAFPPGDTNLLKLETNALLEQTTPRFYYLWRPGW